MFFQNFSNEKNILNPIKKSLAIIRNKTNLIPKVAIILGSGLGDLAKKIKDPVKIPYDSLPGFPIGKVKGHKNTLILGTLNGVPVACMQGRVHCYEGTSSTKIKTMIYTLRELGCETLITTGACGSLNYKVKPGDIVAIHDHINLSGTNPLVGENIESIGSRFPSLQNAYDKDLRDKLYETAKEIDGLTLHHNGIYCMFLGPTFESNSEISMIRRIMLVPKLCDLIKQQQDSMKILLAQNILLAECFKTLQSSLNAEIENLNLDLKLENLAINKKTLPKIDDEAIKSFIDKSEETYLAGMSVIPGVIVARHCGMKVIGFGAVTNLGSGMDDDELLSHEQTIDGAEQAKDKLCTLIPAFFKKYAKELTKTNKVEKRNVMKK